MPGAKRFQKIYIEISNVCNLQCSFCPEVEREKAFMTPELFKRVIELAGPLTEEVCFHLMGEPLAHPRFSEYVQICAAENVPVNITSNGTLLNETRTRDLLDPIVKQINFSVHSFEANFPDKNIEGYLEKIFSFTGEALLKRPDLYINYRLWNLKDGREPSQTDQIIFKKIQERFQKDLSLEAVIAVDVKWKKNLRVTGRLFLHFDSRFEWPSPAQPFRSATGFCHGLGSHIGILADGTVVPCCLDKEGRIALGNCKGRSLDEILAATRAKNMAEGFQQGRLVESLCQKCTFISRFDKKAQKLKSSVNAANVVMPVELL